ncbi:hypothetical protein L596_001662 [Steinernema carpocapsae]|uniref:Myb-like domain-containing protein n=1 Tax=Steinernema carpocapsae TaxID=34508 RepID=A0A4U8UMW1_STECR|nr:hypothetical protein L596_001662 [Steinernema carpocapsae]
MEGSTVPHEAPPKRGRGRPKKSSMEGSTAPHEAPPKHGRGRPKKSSMEGSTAPHEAPPKRGRGRPKKSSMEGSTAPHEAPSKRGRGRPKGSKNKIANLKPTEKVRAKKEQRRPCETMEDAMEAGTLDDAFIEAMFQKCKEKRRCIEARVAELKNSGMSAPFQEPERNPMPWNRLLGEVVEFGASYQTHQKKLKQEEELRNKTVKIFQTKLATREVQSKLKSKRKQKANGNSTPADKLEHESESQAVAGPEAEAKRRRVTRSMAPAKLDAETKSQAEAKHLAEVKPFRRISRSMASPDVGTKLKAKEKPLRRGAKSRAAAEHEAEAKRRRVTRSKAAAKSNAPVKPQADLETPPRRGTRLRVPAKPKAEVKKSRRGTRSQAPAKPKRGATSNAEAESEESQEVKPLVPDVLKFSGRPERESEEWTPEDDYHLVNAFHKYSTWHYDGTQYRVKVLSWRYISDRVSFHSAFIRSPLQCHDRFSLIGNPTWPPPSVDVFAPFVPDAPPSFVEPIDPENVPPRERLGLWNRHAIGLPDASHCFRTRGLVRRVRLLHRRYRSNPARRTLR